MFHAERLRPRRLFSLGCLAMAVLACMPSAAPAHATLVDAGPSSLSVADALEALVASGEATPGDRRYAYERLRRTEPRTAEDALARAIVTGRLAQVSGLAAPGLVAEVERYARQSASLDPTFRFGAAERVLGTLYVMAPASLLAHGDSETGLELLEGVTKRFPAHPPNHLRLAEAYVALGDKEPARPHLCSCRTHVRELRADEQKLLADLEREVGELDCR